MIWLLLLIAITADGFQVAVIGAYDSIAQCHVAATTTLHWEDRMPINQEAVCMAADPEFAE